MLKNVIWCHCRCLYMLRVMLSLVHIWTFILIVTQALLEIWTGCCCSYSKLFLLSSENFNDFLHLQKNYQFWRAPRPFDFSIFIEWRNMIIFNMIIWNIISTKKLLVFFLRKKNWSVLSSSIACSLSCYLRFITPISCSSIDIRWNYTKYLTY